MDLTIMSKREASDHRFEDTYIINKNLKSQ